METRQQALEEIAALARRHGLTAVEIADALSVTSAPAAETRHGGALVRVLAFLGGTFVFAGIGVFIALQWDDLNSLARVVITLGPGVAAFVLGVLANRDSRVEKVTAPLLLVAAVLEPVGMLVAFKEFGSGGDWRWAGLITCAVVALQFAAITAVTGRTVAVFVTMTFATLCLWTSLDLLDVRDRVIALVVGATMITAGVGAGRSRHRDITPLWYLIGTTAFLAGLFEVVKRTPLEIVFLGTAAAFVYLSVVVHSRTLLVTATLAILVYTGWFTGEHFLDSVGWPLALIAFGVAMIGLSALAFRIDRNYVSKAAR